MSDNNNPNQYNDYNQQQIDPNYNQQIDPNYNNPQNYNPNQYPNQQNPNMPPQQNPNYSKRKKTRNTILTVTIFVLLFAGLILLIVGINSPNFKTLTGTFYVRAQSVSRIEAQNSGPIVMYDENGSYYTIYADDWNVTEYGINVDFTTEQLASVTIEYNSKDYSYESSYDPFIGAQHYYLISDEINITVTWI